MKRTWILVLPLLALFLTGCPRNEYEVKLTPHGDKISRELVFYRADGQDSNGIPKYENFPEDELNAITTLYSTGGVKQNGDVHTAKGEFSGPMPSDVGGAGSYTNFVTSMGSAGFYSERFRGDDDVAGLIEQRIAAANQLVDIVVDWSKAELGAETNYARLRQFLDGDFRKDIKNAAFYWNEANIEGLSRTNAIEECEARITQYFIERGYLKMGDVPALYSNLSEHQGAVLMQCIRRLVVRKLGLDELRPLPSALAFLHDLDAMEKSFTNYFAGTGLYHDKIGEWEKTHKPDDQKPSAEDIAEEQIAEAVGLRLLADPDDHLTVKLALPKAPAHTNGRWDETNKMVVWDSDIEIKTNATRLPVVCYAIWVQADENYQERHFGRVILTGDDLVNYCLWRGNLNEKQGAEWEKFLVTLQPAAGLSQQVKSFRFSDEEPNSDPNRWDSPSHLGRVLMEDALK